MAKPRHVQRIVEEAQKQQRQNREAERNSSQEPPQQDYLHLDDRIGFIGAGQASNLVKAPLRNTREAIDRERQFAI